MTDQQRTKLIGMIVIVLLVGGGTAGVIAVQHDGLPSTVETTTTTPTPDNPSQDEQTADTSSDTDTSVTTDYKNGTYSADGQYITPDGPEEIGVTLTITNDIVTKVSVDNSTIYSREAQEYTARFISGIDSYVVGKDIDTINVSRVSGSSLTSSGFNAALASIKHEAAV